jgi:hypothetical protein
MVKTKNDQWESVLRFPVWRRGLPQDKDLEIPHEYHGYPQDGIEKVVQENLVEFELEAKFFRKPVKEDCRNRET